MVRIHTGSIERFIHERDTPEPIPDPAPRKPGEVRGPQASPQAPHALKRANELLAILAMLRDPHGIARPARLWFTLTEASDYSGLPAATLRDFIAGGHLNAWDVGVRRGGRWRIRRIDLERLEAPQRALPAKI